MVQSVQVLQRLTAGQNNLLFLIVKLVENIKEFLLGSCSSGNNLNIVNHHDINILKLLPEYVSLLLIDSMCAITCELFTGHIKNL